MEFLNFHKGPHNSVAQGVDDMLGSFETYKTAVFPYHLSDSKEATNYPLTADNRAYSSSSVLNFDRPGYYSSPDQEECDLWIDTTIGEHNHNADVQYQSCFANANSGHHNPIRRDGISGCGYNIGESQLAYMCPSTSSTDSVQEKNSQKRKQEVINNLVIEFAYLIFPDYIGFIINVIYI